MGDIGHPTEEEIAAEQALWEWADPEETEDSEANAYGSVNETTDLIVPDTETPIPPHPYVPKPVGPKPPNTPLPPRVVRPGHPWVPPPTGP